MRLAWVADILRRSHQKGRVAVADPRNVAELAVDQTSRMYGSTLVPNSSSERIRKLRSAEAGS
jgi:hypothetical protein